MSKPKSIPPPQNDSLPFRSAKALAPEKVVDLFVSSFKYVLALEELPKMIQLVKGELFKRDYLSAFDSDDKRFAYVARWTPARALAYSALFGSCSEITALFEDPNRSTRVLCIGGGAASELVGMASVFCCLKQPNGDTPSNVHMDVIDIADWSAIVANLTRYVQETWLYSGSKFNTRFLLGDVLCLSAEELLLRQVDLITLLFTTNELFHEKKTETIKLLQRLNAHGKKGALLLIAESAGSYSHITVGSKQFPVQFLVDTILAGKPGESGSWKIVKLSESCWYRVQESAIRYPVKLENMRFFYRLYQKT